MDPINRDEALRRLDALVGEWSIEVIAPWASPDVRARMVCEWVLGGQFLLQRSEVDVPEAPDARCLIGADLETGALSQHYFDSRGVKRIYAMTLDDEAWTLTRERPDVSPLAFAQRFRGVFEDGGATIRGTWEIRHEGKDWEDDFDMVYRRVSASAGPS